ncbi:hypothetical protein HF086_007055 [Spodoptera exigua]|uniref:Uncharacterized protein n=1 Tax=Spodoptera exigua TaxID=7107 RepID=A0A922SA00_SPOEX|nr:hypothetical protein HF086_007055 [Spodoptera exigua]
MQTTRESSRQKRCNKRRNSRKKSLSPSDLKCTRGETKTDSKLNGKRSLSEGSVKVKHRKSNIRRTLTHPFTCSDDIRDVSMIGVFNKSVKVDPAPPESDESNLPPTSSDRDTEDDGRLSRPAPQRSRWDSGSEMDSLVSTVVRRASARRRRTPANPVIKRDVRFTDSCHIALKHVSLFLQHHLEAWTLIHCEFVDSSKGSSEPDPGAFRPVFGWGCESEHKNVDGAEEKTTRSVSNVL